MGYCIDAASVDNRISALEEQMKTIQGDFFKNNHTRDEYIIDVATVNAAVDISFNKVNNNVKKINGRIAILEEQMKKMAD